MFQKQQRKLKRMATFVAVLSKHGFQDVLERIGIYNSNEVANANDMVSTNASLYTRLRLVLEELGPTFVKFGQALSNREDFLPKELVVELQHLQDNVHLADIDLDGILADNFGQGFRKNFQSIDYKALASASIAQVYRATLKSGEEVVLKIKRPNINEVIESDLLLLKDIASLLTQYFEFAQDINLIQTVNAFERALLLELSLIAERENIERFALLFKSNPDIYITKTFPHLCNNDILCIEFIQGAKITDFDFLERHQLNPKQLAKKGLELYLSQILEHGFFHADPHPGNILVSSKGVLTFIDLGSVGTILPSDQELLEDIIIYSLSKNVKQLIIVLKKMAVHIDIKDEKKLYNDLNAILKAVNENNLKDLNISFIIEKFKDILFENKVVMPDYFLLLGRGIVLIESVGRLLNPDLNAIESIEPYVKKIISRRLRPQYLLQKGLEKWTYLSNELHEIPIEMRHILQQLHDGNLVIQSHNKELESTNRILKRGFIAITVVILLGALLIAWTIFRLSQ